MYSNFRKVFVRLSVVIPIALLFTFSACDDNDEISPINKLQAVAGEDQSGVINSLIILNGSSSTDGNNKTFSYQWSFNSKPTGSNSVVINADKALASFVPDIAGVYKITLTIKQGSFSHSDEMIVTISDPVQGAVVIDSDIFEDRILEDIFEEEGKADYIVTADIKVRALLTIKPGVVIEFENGKSLQIEQGALVANGTENSKIIFTGTQKTKGHWKGLWFYSNSELNQISHSIIEYAGSQVTPEFATAPTAVGIIGSGISGGNLALASTIVRQSGGFGLYATGLSNVEINNNTSFLGNEGSAIFASPHNLHKIHPSTVFTQNGFNGIETGGKLDLNEDVVWTGFENGSYLIKSDLNIASTLTITENAHVLVSQGVLIRTIEDGLLKAIGTENKKIVFEAHNTLTYTYWTGIVFGTTNENILKHVIVRHTGLEDIISSGSKSAITLLANSKATISNSSLEHGHGWGIVIAEGATYNEDIGSINNFSNLSQGDVKLPIVAEPISLIGDWVDANSFAAGNTLINSNYYSYETGTWFEGATDPWKMNPKTGFGLKINSDGTYTWIIAMMHSPGTECFTYSAEYFKGTYSSIGQELNLTELQWRSKYFNSCDESENIDMDIEPGSMTLTYETYIEYNAFTGNSYLVLALILPDGTEEYFYRVLED